MQPHPGPNQIPEQTAAVARAAFPKGSLAMRLADGLGLLYEQADFAALYSATGRPGEDPVRLALVSIFQFLEGLSDRQAADAVRGRIDAEVCFAAGTHRSWLCLQRVKRVSRPFDRWSARAAPLRQSSRALACPRLASSARGRQRTDSTHVLGAIRQLNRLEFVIETMRHALNTLAVVAPEWIRAHVPADWVLRYDHRAEDYRLPDADHERTAPLGNRWTGWLARVSLDQGERR